MNESIKQFSNLSFSKHGEYSSDDGAPPVDFYLTIFPNAKEVYLKLGYFSSTAIQTLAYGFAQFVANGGSINIVTNHFIYRRDMDLIDAQSNKGAESQSPASLQDPEWVASRLTGEAQHSLDCLKLLSSVGRLKIVPVMLSPARMVHYKEGVFIDHVGGMVSFTGSCNFTSSGLLENGESLQISRSWLSSEGAAKGDRKLKNIRSIISKENTDFVYLGKEDVIDAALHLGLEKSVEELMEQEAKLASSSELSSRAILEKHRKGLETSILRYQQEPRFPFNSGPRDYQSNAYEAWLASEKCGIFAMATGTGKTITALNCLLEESRKRGTYQAVILVPSKPLVQQWVEEIRSFNFRSVFTVYSENSKWGSEISLLSTSLAFDKKTPFIIISTYQSFTSPKVMAHIVALPSSTILIADEAHNFGRPGIRREQERFPFSDRLALTATPKRRFDEDGNCAIESYFRSSEPYTYSFSMERAIEEKVLCPYEYTPHIVELTANEESEYADISARLVKLFDPNTGEFKNPRYAKILLLERRRVIHKAHNKREIFNRIIRQLVADKKLGFTFIYTPEGEDEEGANILLNYMAEFEAVAPAYRAFHYTSKTDNRSEVMAQFENGTFDALFSMKCLDEGVDIPRAETAIFCSSTGNPRQFIQRRGRVLRRHPEKKSATIHDLVVKASRATTSEISKELERKLFREELVRLVYFASLSTNYYETMDSFKAEAEYYDINLFALHAELSSEN